MTRPRMSRAALALIAWQERAEEARRCRAELDQRLLDIHELAKRVLRIEADRLQGKLSQARYDALSEELYEDCVALGVECDREADTPGPSPAYVAPPAMKS